MMKRLFLFLLMISSFSMLFAEEGMWIPLLLDRLNIGRMQEMGLKLSAEDIYSINHASLKDAIVQFGGGCTAEFISPDGLILTNHHCGLGTIQKQSTLEHDYLTHGFWAQAQSDELANPGLTVTLLIRMEDVTDQVLLHVSDFMTQLQRAQAIKLAQEKIEKEAVKGTHYEAKVRSFFYGNQYYLFVAETFKDVRLVGAPPSGIGQFGGDTDNWMWPRHGADFSLFRVYANNKNEAADYSKDNVPYHPKSYLPISLKGYHKDDFTFVFGYPGITKEYLTSSGIDLIANKENPVRINLRQKRLDIFNSAMNESKQIRIQYTSKHQGIANGWKKMMGETNGIKVLDAVAKKRAFEKKFQEWADSASGSQKLAGTNQPDYEQLLAKFEKTYNDYYSPDLASAYLTEAGMGIEIVRFAAGFRALVKKCKSADTTSAEIHKSAIKLFDGMRAFYKDYSPSTDKKVFVPMMEEMSTNMNSDYRPKIFQSIEKKYGKDFSSYADYLYGKSLFPDSAGMKKFLKNFKRSGYKKIEKDPVYQLALSVYERNEKDVVPLITRFNNTIDSLQRIYMSGLMKMQKEKLIYPDANSTLRIAYGRIDGYSPKDGVVFNYFTTSKGILEKEDSLVYDYTIDPKLKSLFLTHDFGRYADRDGTLHIAFIASNHTTGGNSGSPVLDANGNLIGLNYDRNWEGTMSDLMYDPGQCRNIALDIRYFMFILDKYAGASRLIREMKIVE